MGRSPADPYKQFTSNQMTSGLSQPIIRGHVNSLHPPSQSITIDQEKDHHNIASTQAESLFGQNAMIRSQA